MQVDCILDTVVHTTWFSGGLYKVHRVRVHERTELAPWAGHRALLEPCCVTLWRFHSWSRVQIPSQMPQSSPEGCTNAFHSGHTQGFLKVSSLWLVITWVPPPVIVRWSWCFALCLQDGRWLPYFCSWGQRAQTLSVTQQQRTSQLALVQHPSQAQLTQLLSSVYRPEGFPWSNLQTAYPLCCIAAPTGHSPSVPSPATPVSPTVGVSPGLAVRLALLSCSHGRTYASSDLKGGRGWPWRVAQRIWS